MKINIVYKKEKEWFIGHIQEYPDYESQGNSTLSIFSALMQRSILYLVRIRRYPL
jgi:hypothetical protein